MELKLLVGKRPIGNLSLYLGQVRRHVDIWQHIIEYTVYPTTL